jgi:dihydroneopterin triphosphate diphosphatase
MFKQPISCLVVIHTRDEVLLLERADGKSLWQSVTGSWELGEPLIHTAWRELGEETGFTAREGQLHDLWWANQYEIYPRWRHRYAPEADVNTEHVFRFEMQVSHLPRLAKYEHTHYEWLDFEQAAQRVFSPSNRQVIEYLRSCRDSCLGT